MRQKIDLKTYQQKGMITLTVSLLMLFLVTLVTLYTANTSVVGQKIITNQYRAEQAVATAQAGIDVALERHNTFNDADFDPPLTPDDLTEADFSALEKGDYTVVFCDVWDDGDVHPVTEEHSQTTDFDGDGFTSEDLRAAFDANAFANALDQASPTAANVCTDGNGTLHALNSTGAGESKFWDKDANALTADVFDPLSNNGFFSDLRVGVVAIGSSDDGTARHVITLISSGAPILPPEGPQQPLVAMSNVGLNGAIDVINRYTNANVWTGMDIDTISAATATYINNGTLDPAVSTRDALINTTKVGQDAKGVAIYSGALLASHKVLGLNSDVVDNDYNLSTLNPDGVELFEAFFAGTKAEIRSKAESIDQLYTSFSDASGKSGFIWVDGTAGKGSGIGNKWKTITGGEQRPDSAFVVVDAGGPGNEVGINGTIYGLVFVFGDVRLTGQAIVSGALVATGEIIGLAGSKVVYDPEALLEPKENLGGRAIVAGTWKDWN